TATQMIFDELEDIDMVELSMEDEVDDIAPPPPPPPPPGPSVEEEEEEEEDDEPDEPDEEVEPTELKEEVKEEIKKQDRPKGDPAGVEGGVEGGVAGGVHGGVEGGVVGGTGDGVRVFHHSELEAKKRVQPRYPDAARDLNLGTQRCKARVFIDESGVPYDVRVESCPQAFHPETKAALLKWRWYPPRDGRNKIKAQTIIAVTYQMK
ncbi:MAG TPA: hypothetical protein ENK18_07220, partial [Deltaproteobacteria bacterium]|nr:hypothetical protein [Deltaproteobacteria bacterium]